MGFLGLLGKKLLSEAATIENVTNAMRNRSKVIINYHTKGKDDNTGSRVIEPVTYGLTKTGNPVIRAYQPYGDTTTKTPGWKMFRLDRISYWEETTAKFDKVPDFNPNELNQDGDETMSVVIMNYRNSGNNTESAVNNANIGPKTKEKVHVQTYGDDILALGKRNLDRINNCIKVDVSNNKKLHNGFNMYTQNTQQEPTAGPKFPDQSYQPSANINGSVQDGDISQEELDNARAQVYGDYQHDLTQDEYDEMSDEVTNPNDERNMNRRDRRWQQSTDNMFKNSKNSWNRELYNMDHEHDDDDV